MIDNVKKIISWQLVISTSTHLEIILKKNFSFNKGVTVIFGENGSGKTSILEAIYLLSMGKSFKTNRQKEMIQKYG